MTGVSGASPHRAILFRIDYGTGILALWCGFGNIDVPINDLDLSGQRYQGLGAIIGIPDLELPINGEADRINFGVSAIPADLAVVADADSSLVIGADANIGWARMDEDWQITGSVLWLFDGVVDTFNVSREADANGNQTHSVAISIATATATRRRPNYDTWTDAQQQRAHPGDLFLNQVPTAEKQKRWPT